MPGSSLKHILGASGERVAAHQVWPLVAIHSDPVTEAMGEVRVVGAEAGAVDHLARGGVHRLRFYSRLGRCQRCRLRLVNDIENAAHLVGRRAGELTQNKGAADVGCIAFHAASAIDQQNRAFAYHLWRGRAVRQRRILADLDAGIAFEAEAGMGGRHQHGKIVLRHAGLQGFVGGLVGRQRDLIGQQHERQLVLALDHAAAGGDRSGAGTASIAARLVPPPS